MHVCPPFASRRSSSRSHAVLLAVVMPVLSLQGAQVAAQTGTVETPPAAPSEHQDRVELKDGTIVEGVLRDTGGTTLELQLAGGSRRILRSNIQSVVFASERPASGVAETDAVIRIDGHRIVGEVRLLAGGKQVRITKPGGSRVTLPRKRVLRIIRRGEALQSKDDVFTAERGRAIATLLGQLESGMEAPEDIGAARASLIGHGVFAIEAVRASLAKSEGGMAEGRPERQALEVVERIYRAKEVVAPAIEEYEGEVFTILAGDDDKRKEDLVLFVFYRFPEESVSLARFLALEKDVDILLRSYAIDFLRRMRENRTLLDIFDVSEGRTKLAAAIALGKNKILVGAPTLIDSLTLADSTVREVAVRHLRSFSGENFRFRPDGAPQAREEAIAKWRAWWTEKETYYVELARKVVRGSEVETPLRRKADQLWQQAEMARDQRDLRYAVTTLKQALEIDPLYFRAQVSLAALYLSDLNRPAEALTVLDDIDADNRPDLDADDRYWVALYRGHCHRALDRPPEALAAYEAAVVYDPRRLPGQVARAETAFAVATGPGDLTPKQRRELLRKSLEGYRTAIGQIDGRQQNLETLTLDDLPIEETLSFDRRRYNRTVVEFRQKYRRDRYRYVLAAARVESLTGDRAAAIKTLEAGLESMTAFRSTTDLRKSEIGIRSLLGLLYEQQGETLEALRQYRFVVSELDSQHEPSLLAIQRVAKRRSDRAGN